MSCKQLLFNFVAAIILAFTTLPLQGTSAENKNESAAINIWVATNGNDSASGSNDAPLASLQAAFTRVRELRKEHEENLIGDVRIIMRGGTYHLATPLQLSPDDSGTPNSPTIVCAADGEKVIVSGGEIINRWQKAGNVKGLPQEAQGNVWMADAPLRNGKFVFFRQMWMGNNKLRRASSFDSQSLPQLISVDKQKGELTVPRILQTIENPKGLEMTIIQDWVTNVMRVKTITSADNQSVLTFENPESDIEFKRPWPILRADATSSTNHYFYLSNAVELLNQQQEWYCDPTSGKIYYWPNIQEQSSNMETVVPVLETIVNISGNDSDKVSDIIFRDITFEHSSWLRPSQQGHVPLQAGQWLYDAYTDKSSRAGNVAWVGRPASAIRVSDARNISFEGCQIYHTASTGIDFVKGTKKMTVRGCTFSDIGGSAILAGYFGDNTFEAHEPYNPENKDVLCDSIIIDNNYIAHAATEDWGCLGICVGYASNITISHNEIYDTPYSAISMGWGWTKDNNCMHDNHVVANYIHSFCNQMRDGGAIYTLSAQPASNIEGNRIEDVGNPKHNPIMWPGLKHAQYDIYLDEGSDFFTIKNNWCERGEFSKNKNGDHNIWGANSNSVGNLYKEQAGLEDNYKHIKQNVIEPDSDSNYTSLEYPTLRISGEAVSQLTDGEEYAIQNSNTTLAKRNLYWAWDTYLRSHSDGKVDDITLIAHKHDMDGATMWSFQISSKTGKGQYIGCINGANVQIVSEEALWTAIFKKGEGDEGDGFILIPKGLKENEGHEVVMNGSADWVVSYSDGNSPDRTDATSHWSFIRTKDLNDPVISEYNAVNLKLYEYLIEARQMQERGISQIKDSYEEGVRIYKEDNKNTTELQNAIAAIQSDIAASVNNYEKDVPNTYGILNPSFENISAQHGSDRSIPFGWNMTKDGTKITEPTSWDWCGSNTDAEDQDGSYIWGVWNNGTYGDIELSQQLTGLPNGYWKLTARLMNNHTEVGNMARIFANKNSMLAGFRTDYDNLPEGESCEFKGKWASSDKDMSNIMTVVTEVNDGTLTIGARSNGFFKVDDFQLTYLGTKATAIVTPSKENTESNENTELLFDLSGNRIYHAKRGSIVIVKGKKRIAH